jgi:hypothetical protein
MRALTEILHERCCSKSFFINQLKSNELVQILILTLKLEPELGIWFSNFEVILKNLGVSVLDEGEVFKLICLSGVLQLAHIVI